MACHNRNLLPTRTTQHQPWTIDKERADLEHGGSGHEDVEDENKCRKSGPVSSGDHSSNEPPLLVQGQNAPRPTAASDHEQRGGEGGGEADGKGERGVEDDHERVGGRLMRPLVARGARGSDSASRPPAALLPSRTSCGEAV